MADRINGSGLNDENLQKDGGAHRIASLITQLHEELRRAAPRASVQIDVRFGPGHSNISTTSQTSYRALSSYNDSEKSVEFAGIEENSDAAASVSKSESHISTHGGGIGYSSAGPSSECETLRNVYSWDATKNYDIFEVERSGIAPDLMTLGGLEYSESSASSTSS